MDYCLTSKEQAEAEDQSPSPRPSPLVETGGWQKLCDPARGARRLRLDAHDRIAEHIDATGEKLDFAHDAHGSLRRIEQGDWFAEIKDEGRQGGFSVTDRQGRTSLHFERAGRIRKLRRNGERLSIKIDELERVTRVQVPGSGAALRYDWSEDGDCEIRVEGGQRLLTITVADGARRVMLDSENWFDETLRPSSVTFAVTLAQQIQDTLDLRFDDRFAIAERRWADGTADHFKRDDQRRLTQWTHTDRKKETCCRVREWRFDEEHIIADDEGSREVGVGGQVFNQGDKAVRYTYDASGRRIARTDQHGTRRYRYDPLGNLVAVELPDGSVRRYHVDGMGRRTEVYLDDTCERREYRDETGRLWSVTDGEGRPLHVYIWMGDRLLARIDGKVGDPVAEAYLCDPFGTPNGVLMAGEGHWLFKRLDAAPYGEACDAARPTIYGHFADPLTGLIHAGAREIDPQLGLFLTPDPWHGGVDDPRRWAGATSAMLTLERERPEAGFHDYALCRFDPLGRVDRDGHVSTGDVMLHILRWVLLPTWGFPLTSISIFFFQPINLYMEVVGLVIWAFKQACDDKSHPWAPNTIAGATGLLGSARQFTFAFGLNGFLPRVVAGRGLSRDRAVTVGNVVWINRGQLDFLGRAEAVIVEDINAIAPGTKFNDSNVRQSILALEGKNDDGELYLHFSCWTRGFGNTVVDTAGTQHFDDIAVAGAPVTTAIHLREPMPFALPVPHEDDDDEELKVIEFTRPNGNPIAVLEEAASSPWFALQLQGDTEFMVGEWLRISAPDAPEPKPDPAFIPIRQKFPADDHAALLLDTELPNRFQVANLDSDLQVDGVRDVAGASASADWVAGGAANTIERSIAVGIVPGDFPPSLERGQVVKVDATVPAAGEPASGALPAGPMRGTQYAVAKELKTTLALEPDAGALANGAQVRLRVPAGALFDGTIAAIANRDKITLDTPHPDVEEDDLLVLIKGADRLCVRVTADPSEHVITVNPPVPAAMAGADGARLDLQATRDTSADEDKGTVSAVVGNDAVVSLPRDRLFAPGNFVRFEAGGEQHIRIVGAVSKMEIELSDPPLGTGPFTIKAGQTIADRSRNDVSLAPPGRFLKHVGGAAPSTMGDWPTNIAGFVPDNLLGFAKDQMGAYYIRWSGARPADVKEEFHRVWSVVSEGGTEYVVLETPLPLKVKDGRVKWRADVDDYGNADTVDLGAPAAARRYDMRKFDASRTERDDATSTGRVLALEPEVLVPEDPTVHDTHRRALIEHEINHTVQCNYWGPLMNALPLSGVTMAVVDIVAAAGVDIPEWLQQVERDAEGNPPDTADGRFDNNTELNPFQVFSIGGLMQLAWKYVFLLPFRADPDLANEINDLDFEDVNQVVNPLTAIITQNLPQVDSQADAGDRWLAALGQLLSKGLDLRSWQPFLGFVPTLLPDGPQSFLEQGASRASGDLYSTIVTANDRYNLTSSNRLFGRSDARHADLHVGLGRPVRLLMFCAKRGHRMLEGDSSNAPVDVTTYRKNIHHSKHYEIDLPNPGSKVILPAELYTVQKAAGAVRTFKLKGPAPARRQIDYVEAETGDIIYPRLRSFVPVPPTVNRTLGFYLIAGSPAKVRVGRELSLVPARGNDDALTDIVTITVEEEVRVDDELVPWTPPLETAPSAPPAVAPAAPHNIVRFQTELSELKIKHPKDMEGPEFETVGIDRLVLDLSEPTIDVDPLADNDGWALRMPTVVPGAPSRMRIFRTIAKDDPSFDLQFSDVPTLAGTRSYLDDPIIVVVRDSQITVQPLPPIADVEEDWDDAHELTLPIKLEQGESAITIVPPAGFDIPSIERIEEEGRKDKWRIDPLEDSPPEDVEFRITVSYGRVGATVDKTFKLTFKAAIGVTAAGDELIPGVPLDINLTRGTSPYSGELDPEPDGLELTQPSANQIVLLAKGAPEADTEIALTVTDDDDNEAVRRFTLKAMPPILLPNDDSDYNDYIRPATQGLATPLINGRSSGGAGPDIDLTEPLDEMENAVAACSAGDSVYLSAWFFEPATALTAGAVVGLANWGELLAKKARDRVKIRLLINDFDPITGMDTWLKDSGLDPLDTVIAGLPANRRDNLKYQVAMHPASVGALKALLAGQDFRDINIASHHQKFMVVHRGDSLTAFCGGIDIESRKTPSRWSYGGLIGWHDLHVKLEGPITRDLEREFVMRWNFERSNEGRPARPGWAAMEELVTTPLSAVDDTAARKVHLMQMLRTVSVDGIASPWDNERDDIKRAYRGAIRGARNFLYLENQYFRDTDLADWIVEAGTANPSMRVIIVVIGNAGDDDGDNAITEHGNHLQHQFFDRITNGLGARAAFYTMKKRAVHSKFMLVDDAWMTIGSANANVRSFDLDSELNVQISDAALTQSFRHRLWAYALGVSEATVSGWNTADFISEWNSVAVANAARAADQMEGEGILQFDHNSARGSSHGSIPDGLTQLDLDTDDGTIIA